MTQSSDERQERLKQIREREPDSWRDRADIDFLLSLLDSQAVAGGGDTLVREWSNVHPSAPITRAYHDLARRIDIATNDAATRMREACVKALRELRDESNNATYQAAYNCAIRTLQSLTLDQVEEKQ